MQNNELIVILGPTATGKTKLAAHLAEKIDGEVISADSRQVYRGMDIGTGKDLADFVIENKKIPYHLIDIIDAGKEYNVFEFQEDFYKVFSNITNRNKKAILCGGSGLYLESVLKSYQFMKVPANMELREELEKNNIEELNIILQKLKPIHNTTDSVYKKRIIRAIEIAIYQKENQSVSREYPKLNYKLFGIQFEREILKKRITQRLLHRIENEGMIDEVKTLISNGVSPEKLMFYGLEYKFITLFLNNELSYEELIEKLTVSIHQFAKRQSTWFRKMEREGFQIHWIDGNLPLSEKLRTVLEQIN